MSERPVQWLLWAALIHGAFLVGVVRFAPRSVPSGRIPVAEVVDIEVIPVESAGTMESQAHPVLPTSRPSQDTGRAGKAGGEPASPLLAHALGDAEDSMGDPWVTGSTSSPASSANAGMGRPEGVRLGLGGELYSMLSNPMDRPSPRPETTSGGLRELLAANDVQRGFGEGGPVASRVREAALRFAPPEGHATLEAQFDSFGKIRVVHVLGVSSDATQWRAVANAALQQLAGRGPSPRRKNLAVAVRVQAHVQYPSGSGAPVEGTGPGAKFDLSDIGATRVRMVTARVVGERRL